MHPIDCNVLKKKLRKNNNKKTPSSCCSPPVSFIPLLFSARVWSQWCDLGKDAITLKRTPTRSEAVRQKDKEWDSEAENPEMWESK